MEEVNNVPALRFPEHRDLWRVVNLGDAFSIFNGYAFSSNSAVEYGVRWVKIADVGIQVMKDDSLSYLPPELATKHSKFILKKGDYVIALTRPILNGKLKIAMISDDFAGALLNQRVGKIVTENVPTFIYNLLQKELLIKTIEDNISGSDPPNLAPGAVNSIPISIPSLPEQQKIASFLTAVDDKIQQLSKKKALLEQYKKGVMQKLFSQKLRFKDDQGNEFPDWKEQKLGTLCINISSGTTKPGIQGEYNVYGSTGVLGKSHTHTHSGNFILVARVGANAGTVNIVDGNFAVTDNTLIVECRASIDVRFMYYLLVNMNLKQLVFGSGQPLVTAGQIKAQIIQLPSELEQRKIASFLSAIDNKINGVTQQIEQTQQFKKGLLQQMFI